MAALEAQALLRFLTQDAKVPLATAIPRIGALRKIKINTPDDLSKASSEELKSIFGDEKIVKQVQNAAKRAANPRKRPSQATLPLSKRSKTGQGHDHVLESEMTFPTCSFPEDELVSVIVETNRAPLFLAFTVVSLKYTRPEQPLSSCFSLAQAVVSAGAQSRAKYLGITNGPTAEEDGWAQGQPKVRIMGREVAVMRRHTTESSHTENIDLKLEVKNEARNISDKNHEAFWGIDLEALRRTNGPLIAGGQKGERNGPPIHLPQAARSYLLRSIVLVRNSNSHDALDGQTTAKIKKEQAHRLIDGEAGAAAVLKALDVVFDSWKNSMSGEELDRKAQSWYASVRPDVLPGKEGWGQRGKLSIKEILKLRKPTG